VHILFPWPTFAFSNAIIFKVFICLTTNLWMSLDRVLNILTNAPAQHPPSVSVPPFNFDFQDYMRKRRRHFIHFSLHRAHGCTPFTKPNRVLSARAGGSYRNMHIIRIFRFLNILTYLSFSRSVKVRFKATGFKLKFKVFSSSQAVWNFFFFNMRTDSFKLWAMYVSGESDSAGGIIRARTD
jgi:hypothetical protein